jgi:hypothetical protein
MWWVGAIAGAQLATNLFSARESSRIARRQSDLQRAETDEAVRRFSAQSRTRISEGRALGAASGIESDSTSITSHLTRMTTEFDRQAEWMKSAGYAGADITKQASDVRYAGDVAGALFQFGAANNWWRKPAGGTGQ